MIKSRYIIILLISCLFLTTQIQAQFKNDFHAGLYNIGFGGIVGGIGAVINKKPNDKLGKVFLKGFSKGALGGYLLYESKHLVGKFSKTGNYAYIWPSKIVNAAGVSIIENASANRQFWEQWHLNIGFNRFEFYTQDKFKVSYRIIPFALSRTISAFTQWKMDFDKSLKMGTFVFNTDYIKTRSSYTSGRASSNIIVISKFTTLNVKDILAHEIIHVYQYESFSGFNTYLNKSLSRLNTNKKWAKIYHKIFYTDFNFLSFQSLYSLYKTHDSNFYENEARYYTKHY